MNTSDQEFRVGQKVRMEDTLEGIVTRVEGRYIWVDGAKRYVDHSPTIAMTRTITVIEEPKPDEPTGLGAVVRDRDGALWVLVLRYMDSRRLWRHVVNGSRRTWSIVDAVEVLFPGVES